MGEDVGTAGETLEDPPYIARLTVVESVYYQAFGEDPFGVAHNFSRGLETNEQPYIRKLTATEEWTKLDTGWLEKCSELVIVNEEGNFPHRLPTAEKRLEISKRIIEVGNAIPYLDDVHCIKTWEIRPKEDMRGCPADLDNIYIRCQSGRAKLTVYIIPS